MPSWLSKIFPPTDYRQRYADMSDLELAAIQSVDLKDLAKKCYQDEVSWRKQYAELSDENLAAVNKDQLPDGSRLCFEREAERRSRVGDCRVRVISGAQVNMSYLESRLADTRQTIKLAHVGWPAGCARCADGPTSRNHLSLHAKFKVSGGAFSTSFDVPICIPCHESPDTASFISLSSSEGRQGEAAAAPNPMSLLGQAPTVTTVQLAEPIDAVLLNGGTAVTHMFWFANHVFGARFKKENSPTFPCSKCSYPVGNPFKRCPECEADRPIGAYYFSALKTFAAYVCSGCNREVGDDDVRCPHCHLKQPDRHT